jgi:hypothetical protein
MNKEQADAVATQLVRYLETGEAPEGLFSKDVFVDFTPPLWRVQAQGRDDVLALRRGEHPTTSRVPRWRCDPTPTGLVLEVEEEWERDGDTWYCRELFRADVRDASIVELSVYCTGDWNRARRAEHARDVQLLRP